MLLYASDDEDDGDDPDPEDLPPINPDPFENPFRKKIPVPA